MTKELLTATTIDNQEEFNKLCDEFPIETIHKVYADNSGYERVPVGIDQFIEDDYYMGKVFGRKVTPTGDVIQEGIWPVWREKLRELYPNPFTSHKSEVIVTGAIGIGKTTLGRAGLHYVAYRLGCLKDPHRKYGILSTDKIVFVIYSATLDLSSDVLWGQIQEDMITSPYYQDQIQKAKETNSRGLLPKNIGFVVGSRAGHGLGRAVFGGILDESNFQGAIANQARDSYVAIRTRMTSRFMETGGTVPGQLFMLSSRKSDDDFLDQHIRSVGHDPATIVYSLPIWEAHKGTKKDIYSKENPFKVFLGDDTTDPFIEGEDGKDLTHVSDDRIMEVPIELLRDFKRDLPEALRALAGSATISTRKLIRRIEDLDHVLVLPQMFTKEIISISLKDSDYIWDYAHTAQFKNRENPTYPRFIHVDLALTGDRAGIGCVHVHGTKTVERYDPVEGRNKKFSELLTSVDWVLYLQAIPGDEIPIWKILKFIVELRDDYRYNINRLSADGFQSADLLQRARVAGLVTTKISCDRTKEPYSSLKNAIIEDRIKLPIVKLLRMELKELVDVGGMYDHPAKFENGDKGSKDGADGIAGAQYSAVTADIKHAALMSEFLKEVQIYNEQNSDPVKDMLFNESDGQFIDVTTIIGL